MPDDAQLRIATSVKIRHDDGWMDTVCLRKGGSQ